MGVVGGRGGVSGGEWKFVDAFGSHSEAGAGYNMHFRELCYKLRGYPRNMYWSLGALYVGALQFIIDKHRIFGHMHGALNKDKNKN